MHWMPADRVARRSRQPVSLLYLLRLPMPAAKAVGGGAVPMRVRISPG
jgi:hypothetical protein